MLKEIEVEGVGVMRVLNDWQLNRIMRIRGPNKEIAFMAFGLGMTFQQFKKLTPSQKSACWSAFCDLTSPPIPSKAASPRNKIPRPYERVSEERQIELGKRLLEVKEQLPHGHFRPWIEKESGITAGQAQRFMRLAKG